MESSTMKFQSKLKLLLSATIVSAGFAVGSVEKIEISQFAENTLQGWEEKAFSDSTDYQLTKEGDRVVLAASASSSASVLGKKIKIDLIKTPYLNWSWRVDNRLDGLDETSKSGDDYVARIYVVKSGGFFVWKTKALTYVWSSNQAREQMWPNPFQPKNSTMLSVRGKEDPTGQWITEKRNVREDLRKAHGKDFDEIDGVALMTDTDNSGLQASAAYGDIFFSAE